MTRRIIISISTAVLLLSTLNLKAQDPGFTQFYSNPLYLNPAFAGSIICPRLVMNYRNQWPAITGTYVTYSASYDQHFDALSGGLGILFYNDQAGEGTLNTTSASLLYSYRLQPSRNLTIKAGIQGTFQQRRIDWDKLTFPDMIDPRSGFTYLTSEQAPPKLSRTYADFSLGFLGFTDNFVTGFGVHHLTQPQEGFYRTQGRLPMKITAHIGGIIPLEGGLGKKRSDDTPTLAPNLLYMHQQNFNHLAYGFFFKKKPFNVGLMYRMNIGSPDAIMVLAGFQETHFKIGYSYDFTVSKLSSSTGGAHEISFIIEFPCPRKTIKRKIVTCPSFN
ncbi:MAG: type IX secretion system membrane protein PorP/SprF [Bacteroidetes bacterium]|nr:type IX secretion system membrane protein PorP/SprF [Bacteroidota bacterium]MBU1720561.1 type IX secretion system membrane protein PorP/SprF [Bacteroidota bacterium]